MTLAKLVYGATESFPKTEQFGLALQLRRSAVSVPSNIAEGAARGSSKEFAHYLSIALGSLAELDTQLELAVQLGFIGDTATINSQRLTTAKLVTKLRQSIQARTTDH
jgi:four helix bundle protein